MTFRISTNLDSLMELHHSDEYLFFNYTWKQDYPDMPNRVSLEIDCIEEAMAIHHELWKAHVTPLFKTWL